MQSYKFGGGSERAVVGPLAAGDYQFAVAECQEPYQKDNGNWVLRVRLAIQPGGETVFDQPWSGHTGDGEARDGIGDFLLAVNRAPKEGTEPSWAKVVGARGKCRLKVELAQAGALAGKEVNKVHYYYKPKELAPPPKAHSTSSGPALAPPPKAHSTSSGPADLPEPLRKMKQEEDDAPQDIPF